MGESETQSTGGVIRRKESSSSRKSFRDGVDMERFILWGLEERLREFPPRELIHTEGEKVEEPINNLKKLERMGLS